MSPTEKRNLKRILLLFIYPFVFLMRVIPRDKNIWIFGNFKGYLDNPKYLFEYLNNDDERDLEVYWITKDKKLHKALKSDNKNSLYYYSLKGIWKSYRAGGSFLANGYSDVNKLAALDSFIVNLWHGTPIKKIFFDAELEITFYSFGLLNDLLTYLNSLSTQFLNNKIDLFFVSSDAELKRMSKAFRISEDIFRVMGVPRIDVIGGMENEALGITDVFKPYNTTQGKNIVYAPSWREKGWASDQVLKSQKKLEDLLERQNSYFFIKRHPLTTVDELKSWGIIESKRIKFLGNDHDINGIYQFVDVIITDFSSVIFDFGIFNRPILFFITDLSEYSNNRGFYDSIDEISGARINTNWDQLINSIENIDSSSKFVNHPHFDYLVEKPFSNVRRNIVEAVKQEIRNA